MIATTHQLTPQQLQEFEEKGYTVVRGLLSAGEVDNLLTSVMSQVAAGPIPGFFEPKPSEEARDNPLEQYPRIIHPHRINKLARHYLLDDRIEEIVTQLLGEEPLAAQSMFYFKPAGAKGQALHQDNFYLKVEPGTCIAAWIALDRADRENGGLEVVPGTHAMDIFCPEEADRSTSFTRDYVPVPSGLEAVPVDLEPGDTLFFNGQLVHGSQPNTSKDRFRRSFICHYVGRSSERMSRWYDHILTMDGEAIKIADNESAGPCGTEWTSRGQFH